MSKPRKKRKPGPPKTHVRIPASRWTECMKLITSRSGGYGFDPKRYVHDEFIAEGRDQETVTCQSCRLRYNGRVPEYVIRRRQLRGLAYHVRHHPYGYGQGIVKGGRRIVANANSLGGAGNRPKGSCCWCFRPTETGRANWHRYCYAQWSMAAGHSVHEFKEYLPERQCAECGSEETNLELDHRVAIGIAERIGFRAHIRAFTWGNLQWLCRVHHKAKTADDVRRMAELNRIAKEQETGLVRML